MPRAKIQAQGCTPFSCRSCFTFLTEMPAFFSFLKRKKVKYVLKTVSKYIQEGYHIIPKHKCTFNKMIAFERLNICVCGNTSRTWNKNIGLEDMNFSARYDTDRSLVYGNISISPVGMVTCCSDIKPLISFCW